MGKPYEDLTGRTYGRLFITKRLIVNNQTRWECLCSCGNVVNHSLGNIKNGSVKSCGCLRDENNRKVVHGHSRRGNKSKSYFCWMGMKTRCGNSNDPQYKDYGGRGINVCERWMEFANFLEDMGEPPDGKTIDRIDVNGGYSKENCRWATKIEQARNTRSNIHLTVAGETKIIAEWAEISGLPGGLISSRIKAGWDAEQAIFQKPKYGFKRKPRAKDSKGRFVAEPTS